MLRRTLNDIGHMMADVYLKTTGEAVVCTLPAPMYGFDDEEADVLASDDDEVVSIMFSSKGKFKQIGFKGQWYEPIVVPRRSDFDMVFSLENLQSLDMIGDNASRVNRNWLAHIDL